MATPFGVLSSQFTSSVDASNDAIPFWQANTNSAFWISRNTYLNITSQPMGISDTQTVSNKTYGNSNILTLRGDRFTLQDASDTSKQAVFSMASISTSTTRTYTLPNVTDTLVALTATQTLTNKTLTSPAISGGTIDNSTVTVDAVSGHTTSNTGTVYGVSVTSGVIASAALAGSVNTAAIQTNAVTAAKLDTGAIYLGSATITGNQTATTIAAVGLGVTVTIPAGGRKTKITVSADAFGISGAGQVTLSLWDGTVGSGTQLKAIDSNIGTSFSPANIIALVSPAAGSKTYNVGLAATAGTATLYATVTNPALIIVEAV